MTSFTRLVILAAFLVSLSAHSETTGYDRVTGEIRLQDVDMGIALCHFELAAKASGIHGSWREARPECDPGSMEYVVTWMGESA